MWLGQWIAALKPWPSVQMASGFAAQNHELDGLKSRSRSLAHALFGLVGSSSIPPRAWRAPQASYGGYFLNPANAHPMALPRTRTARATPNARETAKPTGLHGAGG